MDYEKLGNKIRMHRKLKGMTQEQLAEQADISLSFFGHIERGTRKPSLDTLVDIANVLEVSPDVLLQDSLVSTRLACTRTLSENNRALLNNIAVLLEQQEL